MDSLVFCLIINELLIVYLWTRHRNTYTTLISNYEYSIQSSINADRPNLGPLVKRQLELLKSGLWMHNFLCGLLLFNTFLITLVTLDNSRSDLRQAVQFFAEFYAQHYCVPKGASPAKRIDGP
ncbi:hypothetical protein BDV95DRAFT_600482 [Massariosphaeria phaeospora]|uniref:Copper transporter n=1 Tax=Massariosphaeria phaeospora TaxID=100035 RepID=A0A7C8MNM7_9PLEO|nr:hypothetical protein BDV95DRAFT_600482 [Massariosphaeria phaeospora]